MLLVMHGAAGSWRGRALRSGGLTLLELLIILAVVVVLIFITLPTLRPTEIESKAEFAKQQLQYLHAREQQYYNAHGTYAPLPTLGADELIGRTFDSRFAQNQAVVEGVVFTGPTEEAGHYQIIAELEDGARYKIDQTGNITPLQ